MCLIVFPERNTKMSDEVTVDEGAPEVKVGVADQKLGLFGLPDLSGIISLVTLISQHMDEIKAIIANIENLVSLVTQVTGGAKAKMSAPAGVDEVALNSAADPPVEDGK